LRQESHSGSATDDTKHIDSGQGAPKHIGDIAAEIVADLRFRRNVESLWCRGPDALYELLVEISLERLLRTYIEGKVARYAAIDPDTGAA
jgi:hypothetical protein